MNIGDVVKVVRVGCKFSTYPKFVTSYAPEHIEKYNRGSEFEKHQHELMTVLAVEKHHHYEDIVAAVITDCGQHVYVIGVAGLEVVKRATKLSNMGGF